MCAASLYTPSYLVFNINDDNMVYIENKRKPNLASIYDSQTLLYRTLTPCNRIHF
jgi:hypothetical protein